MSSSTPDITILTTGGTIDKIYNITGQLEIGHPSALRLLDVLATDLRFEVRAVMAKDSLDITRADRQALVRALADVDTKSVIITHGTDTLALTAEHLLEHACAISKVIVLTGALQPAAMAVSDAALNLGAALISCQVLPPGVYICMGGRAIPAGQARKDASTGRFLTTKPLD